MKATVIIPGGRLTRDVTSIYANEDGTAKRALFTVAVNSFYKDDGEKKAKTDYIPCIAWNGLATTMENWGMKGRLVAICGTLDTFQKEADANGKYPPAKIFVRVANVEFLNYEDNVKAKVEAAKTTTPASTTTGTPAPTADEVAASMLKLINKQKAESAADGVDLSDVV